jgi:hypothetical protein
MTVCVLCTKPVVADPDTLSDGRLVHAGCKAQLTRMPRRRPAVVKDVTRNEDAVGPPPETKRSAAGER